MSVVAVHAKPVDGERGTLSANPGATRFDKYYVVQMSAFTDGAELVVVANDGTTAIPALYDLLSGTNLVVTDINPIRQGKSAFWDVIVTYGPQPETTTGGGADLWGVSITNDGVSYEEDTDKDSSGVGIYNTAGDTFNPSESAEIWDEEITISFSTKVLNRTAMKACRGKINSATVSVTIAGESYTWEAKCLKLCRARYTTRYLPQFGTAIQIWDVDYVFHYRAPYVGDGGTTHPGFVSQIEDKGFYAINSTTGKTYLITDDHGQPKSKPSFLDGSGHELTAGSPVKHVYAQLPKDVSFTSLFTGI